MIGTLLLAVGGIGSFICWIMILIKMFKTEKPLLGIIGIFCGLWAFIWGWMNASKHGVKNIMFAWTACFVLYFVGIALSPNTKFTYSTGTITFLGQ